MLTTFQALPTCDAVTDGVTSDPQSLVNLFWEAVCARAHVGMHVCGLAGNGADCGKEVRVMRRQGRIPVPPAAGPWTSHMACLEPRVFTAWEEMNWFS